jgi:hypothetical protein
VTVQSHCCQALLLVPFYQHIISIRSALVCPPTSQREACRPLQLDCPNYNVAHTHLPSPLLLRSSMHASSAVLHALSTLATQAASCLWLEHSQLVLVVQGEYYWLLSVEIREALCVAVLRCPCMPAGVLCVCLYSSSWQQQLAALRHSYSSSGKRLQFISTAMKACCSTAA